MKRSEENFADSHFHNILRLWCFAKVSLSPQVKGCAIITDKHGTCELSHELRNYLRLNMLVN